MNILHLFPKQNGTRPIHVTIPKRYVYFWEIAGYLSKYDEVTSIDCLDQRFSIYEISKKVILEEYQVVIMLVRTENIDSTIGLANFIKSVKPAAKIVLYGDIINHIPGYFKKIKHIDALVTCGDWELALKNYIDFVKDNNNKPSGVYIKESKKEFPGIFFEKAGWEFTDVSKAPTGYYNYLNGKKQLTITVSRGCPFACKYCLSVATFGKKERRKSVKEVVDILQKNHKKFDSFKLFSPTFNLNNKWVVDFCNEVIRRKLNISWCSTSRIDLLDDENVIKLMAKSGCYKISIGLETMGKSSEYINKVFKEDQIIRVAKYFNKNNITLKGLVMLGVPYQDKESVKRLFSLMKNNNIKIRPTSYSPFEELLKEKVVTSKKIQRYDKFTYYKYGIKGVSKENYYKILLDPENFDKYIT